MDVTVHLNGDPSTNPTKTEGFFEVKNFELTKRIKVLEYDNAELQQQREELRERVKKLANRQPQWPQGYRPRQHSSHAKKHGNWQPSAMHRDKPE